MVEIKKPDGLSGDQFSRAMHRLWAQHSNQAIRIEGRKNPDGAGKIYTAFWDDAVAPVPSDTEIEAAQKSARKSTLIGYTRRLARSKVQAALGVGSDDDEVLVLSEQLRRNAVATARLSRLEKGAGRQDDRTALDALEPMANAIEPIDDARDAIIAKVQDSTYTTEAEIDKAAEWP